MTALGNLVGIGLYTASEAAVYARVHTQTMMRWVHGNQQSKSVIFAQRPRDPERIVTFLDFVQTLAVRAIRREKKIPLGRIREAIAKARDKYQVEFPFAMSHKTYLFGNDILIEIPGRGGLVQISGKHKDQLMLREIAEFYMESITFGEGGLASSFVAFSHGDRNVLMDPSRRQGQPFLPSCDYTADVLLHAYRTEGGIAAAAAAFGVEAEDVQLAVRYYDYLGGLVAA